MQQRFLTALVILLTASSLLGKPPEVKGRIKALDLEKGTITLLEGPAKSSVENSYSLARADIPVTLPTGKVGKLGDLKEGYKVGLQLLGDNVTGIKIIPLPLVASFVRFEAKTRSVAVCHRSAARSIQCSACNRTWPSWSTRNPPPGKI